jgi:adsorption protein B
VSFALIAIDVVAREAMTLACAGFLIGGIDDLALDMVYWWGRFRRNRTLRVADLTARVSGRLAIFVPAWDEADVIGAMLAAMLMRFGDDDFRIYVGMYPNDRPTIDAVAAAAEQDIRVRLVIGPAAGPTTKADCLNRLWSALDHEERAEGWLARAIVLHDAEDVVHRDELLVYRALLSRYSVVQLPVIPLVDRRSRLVGGTYLDEFAEAHAKALVARDMLRAPLPLAGVGCAIDRSLIAEIAERRGGTPFDPEALTEDYEFGLTTARSGARQCFARVRDDSGKLVAVREYFPATLDAAVRQKARWMTGIALSGWDRMGWGDATDWRDHWMRARDRRAPLAVLMLLAAYLALIAWCLSSVFHWLDGSAAAPLADGLRVLLTVNAMLLTWRLAMRALFTWRGHGPFEAALSLPRAVIGNLIAMLAARRALWRYVAGLRGAPVHWDKTVHRYPDSSEA